MSHLRHNKHIAPSIRTLYNFCIFLFFVLLTDQSEINQSSSDEATQVANPSYPDEKRLKFPVCCFVDRVVIVPVIVSDRPLFDEVADDCLLNLLTNASAHSWRLTLERPGSSTSCWFLVRSLLWKVNFCSLDDCCKSLAIAPESLLINDLIISRARESTVTIEHGNLHQIPSLVVPHWTQTRFYPRRDPIRKLHFEVNKWRLLLLHRAQPLRQDQPLREVSINGSLLQVLLGHFTSRSGWRRFIHPTVILTWPHICVIPFNP